MSEQLVLIAPVNTMPSAVETGILFRFLATGEQTGGAYALMEVTALPQIGAPEHRHVEQEAFVVLEGEFEFEVEGRQGGGGVGTFVNIPSMLFHRWHNVGATPGRMLTLLTPGGNLERFFSESGTPVPPDTLLPPLPIPQDVSKRLAMAAKHGIEFRQR
jgi:quercetin dioxygenase-like cupin family protein